MVWTGQTFSVGQVLTAAQMTNLQNDIIALANGDSGAPEIVEAALIAAVVAQLVTNGDSHNHSGGDGGNIPNASVTGLGTLALLSSVTATEIDTGAVGQSEIADNSVGQGEMIDSAIGQSELKTSTAEESDSTVGAGTRTVDIEVASDYVLGAAVRSSNDSRVSSNSIESIVTANMTTSGSYVAGAAFRGTWEMFDSATRYIRVRYVSASPPYIGEDGLMHLFVYCKYIDGVLRQTHICEDPPWRQPEYKKIDGVKVLVSLDKSSIKPIIEAREMIGADKFTHMNETPHPFGELLPNENVVMLDPISGVMVDLLEIHKLGESVAELIHEGRIDIGTTNLVRFAPDSVDVKGIKWSNSL